MTLWIHEKHEKRAFVILISSQNTIASRKRSLWYISYLTTVYCSLTAGSGGVSPFIASVPLACIQPLAFKQPTKPAEPAAPPKPDPFDAFNRKTHHSLAHTTNMTRTVYRPTRFYSLFLWTYRFSLSWKSGPTLSLSSCKTHMSLWSYSTDADITDSAIICTLLLLLLLLLRLLCIVLMLFTVTLNLQYLATATSTVCRSWSYFSCFHDFHGRHEKHVLCLPLNFTAKRHRLTYMFAMVYLRSGSCLLFSQTYSFSPSWK